MLVTKIGTEKIVYYIYILYAYNAIQFFEKIVRAARDPYSQLLRRRQIRDHLITSNEREILPQLPLICSVYTPAGSADTGI
jgi:hypothetical protein